MAAKHTSPDLSALVAAIKPMAEQLARLAGQTASLCADWPDKIRRGTKFSQRELETALDNLLNAGYSPNATATFKELCRALLPTHPQIVRSYIRFYKELWEAE